MAHAHRPAEIYEPEHSHARRSLRQPFGIAQAMAVGSGVFFVVIGAIALARGGIESLTEPTVTVAGLGMTPLLAMIHLLVGVVALASANSRYASRSFCFSVGPFLIAAGVIALVQPVDALGWEPMNGIVYLIVGALSLLAGMTTPSVIEEDRVVF